MDIKIIKAELKDIQMLRVLFLKENDFQFIYNKCHLYGWGDSFLYLMDDLPIGYGANMVGNTKDVRDCMFEFYMRKPFQKYAALFFQEHCATINTRSIKCQSNDSLLSKMLFEFARNTNAEAILFEDRFQTDFTIPGITVHRTPKEIVHNDNDCHYTLKLNDEEVASGGLMLNYNMPYADIYYEVREKFRQRGIGSFFIQVLKNEAYLMGRVPAARCNINNKISKASLIKAGFNVCGYVLFGKIKKSLA